MKMSEKKRSAIYEAIANPIMDLRISLEREYNQDSLDQKLFKLEQQIWTKLKIALGLAE